MKSFRLICLSILFPCVAALAQNNAVPVVNQLVPPSARPGQSGFTLRVEGTGFATGAVVYWNGSPRTTQVLSTDTVQATITTADLAKVGTALVMLSNPAPGGGISTAVSFPIRQRWNSVAMALDTAVTNPGIATVAADFNGDGKIDLATVNGTDGGLTIRLGKGDGTFLPARTYRPGNYFTGLVVGDFNGDGNLDLAVSKPFLCGGCGGYPSYILTVFLGAGDGTFDKVASPKKIFYGLPLAAGDFNGDGKLDLIVTSTDYYGDNWYPSIALGSGDGTFQKGASLVYMNQFSYPAVGDFNSDGKLDIAMPDLDTFQGSPITSVYLGNGDGTFATPAQYASVTENFAFTAAVADLNGDGKLDIITDGAQVLLNNGDGTFTNDNNVNITTNYFGGVAVGDFNGDGKIDFAIGGNYTSPYSSLVFLSNNDGTFQMDTVEGGRVMQAADFNGDGQLDLLTEGGIYLSTAAGVSPTYLSFNDTTVNSQSPPQTATLSNVSNKTMTIESVQLTGTGAQEFLMTNQCGSSLAPGKSCQIQLVFAPTAAGNVYPSLSISIPGVPASAVALFGPAVQ
jgi:hypothetical protein